MRHKEVASLWSSPFASSLFGNADVCGDLGRTAALPMQLAAAAARLEPAARPTPWRGRGRLRHPPPFRAKKTPRASAVEELEGLLPLSAPRRRAAHPFGGGSILWRRDNCWRRGHSPRKRAALGGRRRREISGGRGQIASSCGSRPPLPSLTAFFSQSNEPAPRPHHAPRSHHAASTTREAGAPPLLSPCVRLLHQHP